MGQSAGKIVRRSPSSCAGPNNLPPLQFHNVHGDNIRISRDGTMARRFESFCRAITFSARPVRINERICVRFTEISNNWNGGIRFGFTTNDPQSLEDALPKYACPDLTNRPGFWAKALCEQYCEKDNILYYYVNSAGNVIYGINNEEKGVILTGVDTRGLLWTIIDIYGNCTAIEFLDARIYMYQQNSGGCSINSGGDNSLPMGLNMNNPHQQSRRSLPAANTTVSLSEQDLERHIMPSMQSLNISPASVSVSASAAMAMATADHASDLANGLPPLRFNANGRLIPVPFHITKGRNVRLSHDRFIASRTESDFCQGYVFTARPIRIGEKVIVQILKTEQMYVGALALGLTSCNPATLQSSDLPNDSDFLLDRPEYWVVSKDIASTPQRADEIAFFVAPNGEVTISKNNGPAVVVMHVDQSLQLWAFLDVYGSTQSVRMFRQQLPNMIAYPQQPQLPPNMCSAAASSSSTARLVQMNVPPVVVSESMNSLNSQLLESRKLMHPSQLNVTHSTIGASSSTLASSSLQSNALNNSCAATLNSNSSSNSNINVNTNTNMVPANVSSTGPTANTAGRMISVPSSNGDMIQIQPNLGGTVLVVNLPPATSHQALNELNTALSVSQARLNHNGATIGASGILAGACSSGNAMLSNAASNQFIENGCGKWKDTVDHGSRCMGTTSTESGSNSASAAECTICYENPIDSVLYMCGHMCMCYDCALEQWRGVGGGQCPLCRAVIRDVIRTYTT